MKACACNICRASKAAIRNRLKNILAANFSIDERTNFRAAVIHAMLERNS